MNYFEVAPVENYTITNQQRKSKDLQCRLLRIEEVCSITSVAKTTIRLWVAQSKFPAPLRLSPTINAWRLQDITDWIDAKDEGLVK